MKPSIRGIAAFAVASAFVCAPAFAKDHGEGKGKGHEKQEEKAEKQGGKHEDVRPGAYFNDQHRQLAHRYYEEHYAHAKNCPPGLAKKNNGCMPPGQARKWGVGQAVPRDVTIYALPDPLLVRLSPAPVGYRYGRIGGDVVLLAVSTNIIVDIYTF